MADKGRASEWITAGAGVAGALVGGLFTVGAQKLALDSQADREDRAIARAAHIAASLEYNRLERIATDLRIEASPDGVIVRSLRKHLRPVLSDQEAADLLGSLTVSEAASYQTAITCVEEISVPRRLDSDIRVGLRTTQQCISSHDRSLHRLMKSSGSTTS